jgi:hypothetical protein
MGDSLPFVDLGSGRTARAIEAGYLKTCEFPYWLCGVAFFVIHVF